MIRLHSSRPVKGVPSDLFAAFWKNSRYRDSRSTCHESGRALLFEIWNHVLTDQSDRIHHPLMGHLISLHMAEQHLGARLLIGPGLPKTRLGIARQDHITVGHVIVADRAHQLPSIFFMYSYVANALPPPSSSVHASSKPTYSKALRVYHRIDFAAASLAALFVSAHNPKGKVAAWLLTNAPTGFASLMPLR